MNSFLFLQTYVSSGKVTVAANQINSNRLISPQGTVLTPACRISTIPAQSHNTLPMGNTAARMGSTQQAVTINRLTGSTSIAQNTTGNNLGSTRILHSIVAVANSQTRNIQTSGAKVITQAAAGKYFHFYFHAFIYPKTSCLQSEIAVFNNKNKKSVIVFLNKSQPRLTGRLLIKLFLLYKVGFTSIN